MEVYRAGRGPAWLHAARHGVALALLPRAGVVLSRFQEAPHDLPQLSGRRRNQHPECGVLAPAFAGPQPPAGWTDGYVFANGIRIHYWRTGANTSKPPLVLAHGSSDDGLCWTNLAKEIQDGYDIIMFDARGHGLSDPPTPSDPPDVQVEDLAGLIRELKLERAVLMGHSMGSASVAHFAAKYPDVPRAVILEDPALVRPAASRGVHRAAANCGRAARHHPRPQQHARGDARGGLHEELAEMGTVGVRVLGAVEAPPSPGHGLDQQRRPAADERALREDHAPTLILKADAQGDLRKQNEEVAEPAAERKDRAHHGRRPQRPAGEQERNAGRAAGVSRARPEQARSIGRRLA